MEKKKPGRKTILSEPVTDGIYMRVTAVMKQALEDRSFRDKIRLYIEKEAKRFLGK